MFTTMLALILYQGQIVSTARIFEEAARALAGGDYAAAQAGFEQVLRREPNHLGALGNLGVVHNRLEQPAQAVAIYRRALGLAPREAGLRLNLGLAYMKLENYAAARDQFAGLGSAQARELHAICQLQTGALEAATAALEELGAQPAASPAVLHFLALAYVKRGEQGRARAIFDELLARLPVAEAQYLEGRVWYEAALFERALESYRKAANANRALPGLALETGKTLVSLRDYEQAEAQLREALREDGRSLEGQYFLGALLVQQGRPREALALLESVRSRRPELWGTSYYLGKGKLALGEAGAALPLLEQAARRAPGEAAVQYQLARALNALGRKGEAAAAFARVARLRAAANAESIVMK